MDLTNRSKRCNGDAADGQGSSRRKDNWRYQCWCGLGRCGLERLDFFLQTKDLVKSLISRAMTFTGCSSSRARGSRNDLFTTLTSRCGSNMAGLMRSRLIPSSMSSVSTVGSIRAPGRTRPLSIAIASTAATTSRTPSSAAGSSLGHSSLREALAGNARGPVD